MEQPIQCPLSIQPNYPIQSHLVCCKGNAINYICIRRDCNKTSLHCNNAQCQYCFGLHPYCQKIHISFLQQHRANHLQTQSRLAQIYKDFEQKIIKKIQQCQKVMLKELQYQSLPHSVKKMLFTIFQDGKFNHLTGIDFQQLKQELQRLRPIDKEKLIYQNCSQLQKAFDAYLLQKVQILSSFEANHKISSKILKQQDVQYVFESLGMPRKLQMLYRGSENHFSSAKFHQKCDVVRTEFQRIIAGYTPIPWSSPSSWTGFADNQRKSFLLQVDLRRKMGLVQKQYAIYCNQFHGPRFGRADLWIHNKCNQTSCTGNLPTSYQSLGKYESDQSGYKAFSGAQSGFGFRVLEYEVFHVLF